MAKTNGTDVYAPFPLAVLTCVAVETLGQIIFGDLPDGQSFKNTLGKINHKLSDKIKKKPKGGLEERQIEASMASDLIYTYFRNTLIHGYRGKGVYVDGVANFEIDDDGSAHLNPWWFWEQFKAAFDKVFQDLLSGHESAERSHCIAYIAELLE